MHQLILTTLQKQTTNMKFLVNILTILISNFVFCQVGINVEKPIATLDILNKESTTNTIHVKNGASENKFTIDNASNVHLNGALMPNGDPGAKDFYLTSKGDNTPPVWTKKANSSTIQIFSAQRDNISTVNVDQGNSLILSFPIINSNILPEYGTWNQSLNTLTVNKRGIYHITVGMDLDNFRRHDNNSPISDGNVALFVATSAGWYTGDNLTYSVGSKYNISCITTTSVILNPGNTIYADANTGSHVTRWNQGPSFISIQYSEIN